MAVHNHGPEEGRGLACNELRLPDGSLRGACLLTAEDLAAAHGATVPEPDPIALEAEASWAEHSIGFTWSTEEEWYGQYRMYLAGYEAGRRAHTTV